MIDAADKPLVHVLREDPDLAEALDPARLERAAATAVAPLVELPAGEWRPVGRPAGPVLGVLLLEGLVGNRILIPERSHLELLGPGDVVRPWVALGPYATTPAQLSWCVFENARACLLDSRFCTAISGLPEIYDALAERFVLRVRRLNFQLAANAVTGVEERILLALWHFADRWGKVTQAGVTLQLPLSHRDVADVVGASRPSVSTALATLRRRGSLAYRDGHWLLLGSPPARLRELERQTVVARAASG